ncbi:MAG: biopolymer transport protein ExbB/TolQ [Saprospiraceae bacterium]|jgi:biopolymer transport protein ExbB/TolQ
MFNTKRFQIIISISAAIGLWLLLTFIWSMSTDGSGIQRLMELLGGTSSGYIQVLIYAVFFYSLFELLEKRKYLTKQYKAFRYGLLPEQDQLVLTPEEVAQIKLNTINLEKTGEVSMVGDFIKKACTQYRNEKNVGETLQVFNTQVNNSKEEMEGGLEIVRYLLGAIISLGFIGTLMGLSSSIGMAHLAKTAEGMPEITRSLNLAFDTTLVALLAGLVLNFFYHRYLKEMDTFYSRSKSYVINNLISRIYQPAG